MDNLGPLILDISSDEETGFGDPERGGGGGEFGDREDDDWLSKLLVEVGGNIDDDSDDVVFVSEVFPKSPKKSRPEVLKPLAKVVVDEDDDDCVVLDDDPDKALVVVNNKVDDSDDLEIVGEKGEVACRDFPHPRHLCAKFLFASTPHEVHCGQCHCYVCDSLAPCSHWGTGVSSIDHCHASEKEEYWKAERKNVKKSDKPVSDIRSTSGTHIESFFQSIQVPLCAPSKPNSLPQNQSFIPVTFHPCSRSSNVSLPNVISRTRSQPAGRVAPRYNSQSQLVSVQSHPRSTSNIAPNVTFRNRRHHVGSQNPQSSSPRAVFKRNGVIGASTNNRHPYRFQLSRGPPLNRRPAIQDSVTSGSHGSNQQIAGSHAAVSFIPQLQSSSHHNMDARCANYSPFEPQINSQPYSSYRNPDSVPHQAQMPSQPFVNGNSLSSPPLQPCIYSPPSVGNINTSAAPKPYIAFVPDNPVPSQTVASCQSDAGNTSANQFHSRSTLSSHSIVGNDFDKEHSNPTSPLICGQNDVQQQLHTQIGMFESPTNFGFFSDSSVNHGNMQIHAEQSQYPNTAPAETSQIQNKPEHDQPSIAPVTLDNLPRQSVELAAAYASPINDADCLLPQSKEPGSFNFHFLDSWMFENESFSGAMDVYSPEPAFADPGTLFDI
ncbi:hypothetical protein C2S51_025192 [Perilla frutescens var. frutescens]|nr:hypothetical protein C2S51_025192 [Perilla frutescens var. frutescens]